MIEPRSPINSGTVDQSDKVRDLHPGNGSLSTGHFTKEHDRLQMYGESSLQVCRDSGRDRVQSLLEGNRTLKNLRLLLKSRSGAIGGLLILVLMIVSISAPAIVPYDPIKTDVPDALSAPSHAHPFGTDNLGRDVFSRTISGAQTSLSMGLAPMLLASIAGVGLGLIAGFWRGWFETVIMALMDMLLAFPGILLALAIVAILGPGLTNLMIAVGVSWIPSYARLARGSVLGVMETPYIESARAIGCSNLRILLRHVFPNILSPIIVLATLGIAQAILVGSALSFIGLGIQPPKPEWGTMLSVGRDFIRTAWWMSVFPGLAITISVLAFNMLGDGLRDILDPYLYEY